MGTVLGLVTAGETIGICQQYHYGRRDQQWARMSFDMSQQDMRIGLLSTVREEIRDQVTLCTASLDNMMLVSTLMLSIGFGFVVENVMPPHAEKHDHALEYCLRVAYAFLTAFSLVFPFWCLVLALRMRYEVDTIVKDSVGEIHHQLIHILNQGSISVGGTLRRLGTLSTHESERLTSVQHAERRNKTLRGMGRRQKLWRSMRRKAFPLPEDEVEPVHYKEVAMWAKAGVLSRLQVYNYYYPIAQSLLWMSMASIVMCCCILHSLHLSEIYHKEPWLWIIYMVISGSSAIGSIIFITWMFMSGVVQKAHDDPKVHHDYEESEDEDDEKQPLRGKGRRSSSTYGSSNNV